MSWEKDYEVEVICPNCGTIAKYGVYSDDWGRTEERWEYGADNVEKVILKSAPFKERYVYKCKKCGSVCKEEVIK